MNIKHNQIISLNKQKNVEINKKKFKWTKNCWNKQENSSNKQTNWIQTNFA